MTKINKLLASIILLLTFPCLSVKAQLIPDNTLGTEKSLVNPAVGRDLIEGGAIRNRNLFHSFQEFNVKNGQRVYFSNPDGIANILTRITGSNASKIFGTLGVNGAANLFLVNPKGIIFGENAFLDIKGSFFATTAESIFTDNFEFSAVNPERSPLLKVNITPGLQYGKGTISNSAHITVGKDLSLSASNLDLQGKLIAGSDLNLFAADTLKIEDASNPFIASAGGNLLLVGNQIDIFALNHPESGFFSNGEMRLSSVNTIKGDARFYSGGNFRIEGNLSSPEDPIILAGGDVSLGDYIGASLHILAGGSVSLGDVEINAADNAENSINENNTTPFNGSDRFADLAAVTLSDGRVINVDGRVQPTLDVRAGIDWSSFAGGAPSNFNPGNVNASFDNAATSADITAGNIRIADGGDGGQLLFTNQYRNNGSLTGNIVLNGGVDARDALRGGKLDFDSRGGITVNGIVDASGLNITTANGGDISLLAAGNIAVNDGAGITSNGLTSGNILLNTSSDISLVGTNNGAFISSRSFTNQSGVAGGDININTNSLFLRDGAAISIDTFGAGIGGNLNITATSNVELTGENNVVAPDSRGIIRNGFPSQIRNDLQEGATDKGGDINLKTNRLNIRNGGSIGTEIRSNGDGGNVNVIAQDITLVGFSVKSALLSGIGSRIIGGTTGNSGNVNIKTGSLIILEGALVSTTTLGNGNAGEINITADIIELIGTTPNDRSPSVILANVDPGAEGNAGNLSIETRNLILREGAQVSTTTLGNGDAGALNIIAENIELIGTTLNDRSPSAILANVAPGAEGNAGNLSIETQNLTLRDGAGVSTTTLGNGDAGALNIIAENIELIGTTPNLRSISGVFAAVGPGAEGNGGNLSIETQNLTFRDGAQVSTATLGNGDAGALNIVAENIELLGATPNDQSPSNILADVAPGAEGNAGNLSIKTRNLTLRDGAGVSTSTFGNGNAGELNIIAENIELLGTNTSPNGEFSSGIFATVAPESKGNGSNVSIETRTLIMNEGEISTTNGGNGNPGKLKIIAENIELIGTEPKDQFGSGIFAISFQGAKADGSDLTIETQNLTVSNKGEILTATFGDGNAGKLDITAEQITVSEEGRISTATFGTGKAEQLNINTRTLELNNSSINASTITPQAGGNININASESITVTGAGFDTLQENIINPAFADTLAFENFTQGVFTISDGAGAAGNVLIETPNFTLNDGGLIATTALNTGKGGNITVNAADSIRLDNSLLATGTFTEAESGTINLNARKLTAIGGAQVLTTTFDSGRAGNLNVNISESIDLIDPSEQGFTSGLFASSSETASGRGGDITVTTGDFNIVDGAAVSVSGEGIGNAGDIDVEAIRLFLDNGSITARSISGEGGNINISIAEYLILRNNSNISTQAGTEASGGGNGGNITLNGGFIVAAPNEDSNINANAFEGNGGNITIATPGLFGITFRDRQTANSDITASSEFGVDGDFTLDLQAVDPNNGLIELPDNLTDATDRISAGCPSDEEARFVTSGRGGIPQNPRDVLQSEVVLQDLRISPSTPSTASNPRHLLQRREPPFGFASLGDGNRHPQLDSPQRSGSSLPSPPSRIKEATGWIVNQQGEIEFVADNSQVQSLSSNCQRVK